MRDADVRTELHRRLRITHRLELDSTRFVDELGIAGRARIDTAVLNGSFSGYEIKSESDTLTRLPNQVTHYSTVLDYCYLVTTRRHFEHAAPLIPEWWGVIVATQASGGLRLVRAKRARLNPSIDPLSLSRLLWREEALSALEARQLATGVRSRPNSVLWNRLATALSLRDLRTLVRETLKTRSGWRPDVPRPLDGAR
jgi:hypothetical protein